MQRLQPRSSRTPSPLPSVTLPSFFSSLSSRSPAPASSPTVGSGRDHRDRPVVDGLWNRFQPAESGELDGRCIQRAERHHLASGAWKCYVEGSWKLRSWALRERHSHCALTGLGGRASICMYMICEHRYTCPNDLDVRVGSASMTCTMTWSSYIAEGAGYRVRAAGKTSNCGAHCHSGEFGPDDDAANARTEPAAC